MTICLAAICSDSEGNAGNAVVVASDRMVTYGQLIEFEHEVSKSVTIDNRSIVLLAGDAVAAGAIIRKSLQVQRPEGDRTEDVSAILAQQFQAHRLNMVEQHIFAPRGLSLSQYYGGIQQAMNPQIVVNLDMQAASFQLNIQLCVVGVDNSGAHIHGIDPPGGTYQTYESIGFHAIGSGAIHAIQSLIERKQAPHRSLGKTLVNVVVSKRRSQVAPGVGQDSDVYVVQSSGVQRVSEEMLEKIDRIHSDSIDASLNLNPVAIEEIENALGGGQ